MANINIEIPPDLHKSLKMKAIETDCTLKDCIILILEQKISVKTKKKNNTRKTK